MEYWEKPTLDLAFAATKRIYLIVNMTTKKVQRLKAVKRKRALPKSSGKAKVPAIVLLKDVTDVTDVIAGKHAGGPTNSLGKPATWLSIGCTRDFP